MVNLSRKAAGGTEGFAADTTLTSLPLVYSVEAVSSSSVAVGTGYVSLRHRQFVAHFRNALFSRRSVSFGFQVFNVVQEDISLADHILIFHLHPPVYRFGTCVVAR